MMDCAAQPPSQTPTEVELKLMVSPDHLEALRTLPWLEALCTRRPARHHLISTYFDTQDGLLARQGIAVRVRRKGRQHIQTIKAAQRDAAGLFQRLEWECPVSENVPDLEAIRMAGLGTLIAGVKVGPETIAQGRSRSRGKGRVTPAPTVSSPRSIFATPQASTAPRMSDAPDDGAPDNSVQVLRPVCVTDFHRTEMRLAGQDLAGQDPAGQDWVVLLALDTGFVSAGGRKEAITEVELELAQGTPAIIYALASRLADEVPMRVGHISKAERAQALVQGPKPARPVRATAPTLHPTMTVSSAFQAIGRTCLGQMAGNEPALLINQGQDPEAVHQMRVSVRRLRSAMTIFSPILQGPDLEALKNELRWLMSLLGPARDSDVFLADILDPVIACFPNDRGLAKLRALFSARRDAHYDEVLAAVADARFTRLVLRLGCWIEGGDWLTDPDRAALREAPIIGFARQTLDQRRRKVWKAGRSFDRLGVVDRHRLRILIKKLRYTAEFFSGVFGRKKAAKMLSDLGRLQDQLGALNDVAVAGRLLHETLGEHGENTSPEEEAERAWGAGLVTGWHRRDAADALGRADRTWKRLRKQSPFWASGKRHG